MVGAGVGGLAVAARLAKLGHRVTVCQRGDSVGGLLRPVERDGFSWDTVGSFTLPAVLRDLFRKSGRPIERYLDLQLRTPTRRAVFAEGVVVDLPTGSRGEQTAAVAAALGDAAGEAWTGFVDSRADVWDVLRQRVLDPGDGSARIADRDVARALAARTSLRAVLQRLLPDPRLRLLAAHGALLAGAEPARLPGFVAVEPYVERTFGVWEVAGGMGRLLAALEQRLAERRVELRLGWEVAGVDLQAGRIAGVRSVADERLRADVVVTAVDVRQVLGRLVTGLDHGRRARRLATAEALPGPAITHLGLRGDLPGNVPDEGVWYGDPMVVVRRGALAPPGHSAVTLLSQPMPTPAGQPERPSASPRWPAPIGRYRSSQGRYGSGRSSGADTPAELGAATNVAPARGSKDVLDILAERGLDLRSQVTCRVDRSAADVAAGAGGSPYGLVWAGVRTAADRARIASTVAGLYCLGAGLPLPASVPYVVWQAATVATAIGKA